MLGKRAFGKELTKNMRLWGHHHSPDIKLGQNTAFVSEAACDKNRNFVENWSQLHKEPDHMPTTQHCFSHCYPRDFSKNRGLIYSILLIFKINPALLVPVHCQKKKGAGQDLHVTSPPSFKDSKRWSDAENSAGIHAPGENPSDKGGLNAAPCVSLWVNATAYNLLKTLKGPPSFYLTPVTGEASLIVKEGRRRNADDFLCVFLLFWRGKGDRDRSGALPRKG